MTDQEYEKWEIQVEQTQKHNQELLNDFSTYLKEKGLKEKTIKKHINNLDFYANTFLLRLEIIPIEKGALELDGFLGDFFIRKAMWASKATILENIASFKKFYSYAHEIGKISKDDLQEMIELIKDGKDYWIEEVENYWE